MDLLSRRDGTISCESEKFKVELIVLRSYSFVGWYLINSESEGVIYHFNNFLISFNSQFPESDTERIFSHQKSFNPISLTAFNPRL